MLKKCSRCKEFKEISNFYKDRSCKDGHHYACKICHKLYGNYLDKKNYDKSYVSEYNKNYYLKNIKPKRIEKRIKNGLKGTNLVGRKYELLALKLLPNSIDINNIRFNSPYDIEWNGFKIDVKMRNIKKRRKSGIWQFCLKSIKKGIDYYLLFCCKNNEIIKIILLPKNEVNTKCIRVSWNSKFDKYQITNSHLLL